ncbi:MAG: 30S ribosomal protein S8 [Parcubacteria group bacterium GW2011_GWA2_39_18]|nr:MAG: 30S ribosomal protein S8 [Parcubacteria group bacterium GW2011_GWA2_39_18]
MDSIANMLTIIRNAQMARRAKVAVPYSAMNLLLVKILQKEGFVGQYEKSGKKLNKNIEIVLKYDSEGKPAMSSIKRISKPSRRVYRKILELKPVKQGYGAAIVSTPKGVLSDSEARKLKVGGEVICEVW